MSAGNQVQHAVVLVVYLLSVDNQVQHAVVLVVYLLSVDNQVQHAVVLVVYPLSTGIQEQPLSTSIQIQHAIVLVVVVYLLSVFIYVKASEDLPQACMPDSVTCVLEVCEVVGQIVLVL